MTDFPKFHYPELHQSWKYTGQYRVPKTGEWFRKIDGWIDRKLTGEKCPGECFIVVPKREEDE